MAMKLYSLDEMIDKDLGVVGTPRRDEFETKLAEELHAYHVGEAIRQARQSRKLTQEELGERIGVKKSQICRLEKGKSITLASMMRVFKALGVQCSLEMKGVGKVALW